MNVIEQTIDPFPKFVLPKPFHNCNLHIATTTDTSYSNTESIINESSDNSSHPTLKLHHIAPYQQASEEGPANVSVDQHQ